MKNKKEIINDLGSASSFDEFAQTTRTFFEKIFSIPSP
jgi:hypothetical protein